MYSAGFRQAETALPVWARLALPEAPSLANETVQFIAGIRQQMEQLAAELGCR